MKTKITADLSAAFLKCPLKCWLLSRGARAPVENAYARWLRERAGAAGAAGARVQSAKKAGRDEGKRLEQIAALIAGGAKAPELALNRHCVECEFRELCRQNALEQDSLSLLAGMSGREQLKLRAKGIFTVTQLSHTFRPRRRPRWLKNRAEKYHHALKALAIRERKIHLVGKPELKIDGTPVFLDVEGMPDGGRYYLIGARIGDGAGVAQHSFWADAGTDTDEEKIWREFLAVLNTVERPVLIHYGSYEKIFLRRMQARHGGLEPGSPAARAIESAVNLVTTIYARIYFPTHSNGLKEIARHLGFSWASPEASGTQAIMWRDAWVRTRDERTRRDLLAYNTDDCAALALVTRHILDLAAAQNPAGGGAVVDVATLKRANPYGFKRNQFFHPDMAVINKAAYWDYQREKVYVKTDPRLRRALRAKQTAAGSAKAENGGGARTRAKARAPVDRHAECAVVAACPHCGAGATGGDTRKYDRVGRIVRDLKFTRTGLRRRVTHYHYHRYRCLACGRVYRPQTPGLAAGKFGASLAAYAVWQNIELRMSHEMIDRGLNELFDLRLARGTARLFKTKAARTYAGAFEKLLIRLRSGPLLHVDETKVSVAGVQGCVWIFASHDAVAYLYTPNRESEWLRDFLASFRGVLVTDFYSGYDALPCAKQRCLIHLLRDLNDDLLRHPYDEDLKRLGRDFASLLKPMIATVGQRGLKARFLKKYQASADHFFRKFANAQSDSAVFKKYQRRFSRERDRAELFTFLHHDGVPWNNNNAEHAVKAFALLRQVINGVTSENGLREYLILLSLCETCKYLGVKFLNFLRSGQADAHEFAARGDVRAR